MFLVVMIRRKKLSCFAAVVAVAMGASSPVLADGETLRAELAALMQSHKKIKAAESDLKAAQENHQVAKGAWFPTMGVSASYGHERQLKGNATDDTQMVPRTLDFSVTQKVWDGGSTSSSISSADLTVRQSAATLTQVRQDLLLEAITAHLNLLSAVDVLKYARESEENIKRQAELEDAKVQRGSGFSTDVLQAKAQLAGAQARRVQAQGALLVTENRYKAVFGNLPGDLESLDRLSTPADMIPSTVEEVIEVALKENPLLVATRFAESLALENVTKTKADSFAPVINAVAQSNHARDESGTVGDKHEDLIKLEMTYSFNMGLTALNSLKAAELGYEGLGARLGDAQDQIEEAARNAWSQLLTARENAELLRNQANITGAFLEDARKERALGRRSLIDVLASETALINASSAASQAETSVVLASYTLLSVMGRLDLGTLR